MSDRETVEFLATVPLLEGQREADLIELARIMRRRTLREGQIVWRQGDEARELLIQGQELREYAERGWESEELRKRAVIEAHTKLANILLKFESLVRQASDSGRDTVGIEAMRSKVKDIQQTMLRQSL